MAYCTIDDVRNSASGLLTEDAIGDSQVTVFITDAQSEIDGELFRRYNIPFTDTTAYPNGIPPLIQMISRLLATASSVEDVMLKDFSGKENPGVVEFRKQAREKLLRLRNGKLEIPDPTVRQKPQLSGVLPPLNVSTLFPPSGVPGRRFDDSSDDDLDFGA